ncbi:MAG: hydroxysqualene dehydroxylase HpnE [Planctomycetota bacterium]
MTSTTQTRPEVIVVGGGLAGISAAVRLADAGVRVEVFETRKRLGGRAGSFVDRRSGLEIDNCQHVTMGCCAAYRELLDRLGMSGALAWHDTQYWVEPGGRTSEIKLGGLPAPLHAAPSFVCASFLSRRDKLAIGRGLLAIALSRRSELRGVVFADFLRETRQTESAVRRFWEPVIVSACNLSVDRVSAEPAVQVFQDGLMKSARAGLIGVPTRPLTRLYEAVPGIIGRAGGRVRTGASVAEVNETRVTLSDGETISADRVVLATPFERTARLVAPAIAERDGRFGSLSMLGHSPILGVHMVFDRPVLEQPHAVLLDSGVHWVFRKDEQGHAIHAVVSGADAWMQLDERTIVDRVIGDMERAFPRFRGATTLSARAVKEKRATFSATPAAQHARPSVVGTGSRLLFAGDWTQTGWPATMEGAVLSGNAAAAAVLDI